MSDSVHAIHWFPGNFIPQIPGFLIQILSKPGDIVLDPFGGSGTTAIEAIRLGRRAISADLVSASVLFSRCKIAAFLEPIDRKAKSELLAGLTWDHVCESDRAGRNGEGGDPELDAWYAPRTLRQLRYLWSVLEEFSGSARSVLELVFSDLLFACASTGRSTTSTGKVRRHHWGWVADNVRPKPPVEHNAIECFRHRLVSLPESDGASASYAAAVVAAAVIQQDARAMGLRDSSVDLIVTSPPYVGVIDYVRANRLLYLWMGWSINREREKEIGARYKRHRNLFVEEYIRKYPYAGGNSIACYGRVASVPW